MAGLEKRIPGQSNADYGRAMRLLRLSLCLITVPMLVGCGGPSGERDALTATTVPRAADYPFATVVASPSVGLDSLPCPSRGVARLQDSLSERRRRWRLPRHDDRIGGGRTTGLRSNYFSGC